MTDTLFTDQKVMPDETAEFIAAYVPEADTLDWASALRIAHERDADAAETLKFDCLAYLEATPLA
jgi:hypothetical protein